MHPYELPEIIAVPISKGLPAYLMWIESETLDLQKPGPNDNE
jgi:periplasmic divalent cation tolerance protein